MGACGFERDLVYSRSSLFIFFYLYPTNMESNFLRRSWLFWEGAIILGCCGARKSAGNPLPPPTLCDMSVCMCPYMHDQYPLSTFPLVPSGGVDSLHTQVSHLLLCCHVTHYSECVRACVCLSVSSLSMHVRSRGGGCQPVPQQGCSLPAPPARWVKKSPRRNQHKCQAGAASLNAS